MDDLPNSDNFILSVYSLSVVCFTVPVRSIHYHGCLIFMLMLGISYGPFGFFDRIHLMSDVFLQINVKLIKICVRFVIA